MLLQDVPLTECFLATGLEMFVVKSRETIAHYPSFPLGPPWGETRNLILFLNGKAHRSFGLKNMERDLAGTK